MLFRSEICRLPSVICRLNCVVGGFRRPKICRLPSVICRLNCVVGGFRRPAKLSSDFAYAQPPSRLPPRSVLLNFVLRLPLRARTPINMGGKGLDINIPPRQAWEVEWRDTLRVECIQVLRAAFCRLFPRTE